MSGAAAAAAAGSAGSHLAEVGQGQVRHGDVPWVEPASTAVRQHDWPGGLHAGAAVPLQGMPRYVLGHAWGFGLWLT